MEKSIQKIIVLPFLVIIKLYRLVISPWLPFACRYQPTCSEYSREAFIRHGVIKGLYLSLHRIMRCHPWGGSGYNPVPPVAQSLERCEKTGLKRRLAENFQDDPNNDSQKKCVVINHRSVVNKQKIFLDRR